MKFRATSGIWSLACAAAFLSSLFTGCSKSITVPAIPTAPLSATNTPTPASTLKSTPTALSSVTATPTPLYNAAATLTDGSILSPVGIKYSAGNLWIVGNDSMDLREWTSAGVSLFDILAYNGGSTFSYPWGDAVGPDGDIYVADQGNNQVEVFTSPGAFVTIFGGTEATNESIDGVAVNSTGTTAYVADQTDSLVFSFSIGGTASAHTYTYQSSFGQSGGEPLNNPYNIYMDPSNNLYVSNYGNFDVVIYNSSGTYQSSVTLISGGTPTDMVIDGTGLLLAADDTNNVIQAFNSGVALNPFGQGVLSSPEGVTSDGTGDIYVSDTNNNRVVVFH